VAQTIYYLHHECDPPIIRHDITSNNILLDADFNAYVSDFGIARMLRPDSSNWSELPGTYGYIAPGMCSVSFFYRVNIFVLPFENIKYDAIWFDV
jgi:serine/threonine protein kinase